MRSNTLPMRLNVLCMKLNAPFMKLNLLPMRLNALRIGVDYPQWLRGRSSGSFSRMDCGVFYPQIHADLRRFLRGGLVAISINPRSFMFIGGLYQEVVMGNAGL
jgi:hypothetical protein